MVENGESVVISRNGKPIVRLVAAVDTRKRRLGTMRNYPKWPDGWDRAMTDDEGAAILSGR